MDEYLLFTGLTLISIFPEVSIPTFTVLLSSFSSFMSFIYLLPFKIELKSSAEPVTLTCEIVISTLLPLIDSEYLGSTVYFLISPASDSTHEIGIPRAPLCLT